MNYFDNVFADFKDGDDQQRLDLYLQHRDLRSDFDKIESEESALTKTEITASQKVVLKPARIKVQQSPFVRMKRWCFSILS
jgi:hypothetical protein